MRTHARLMASLVILAAGCGPVAMGLSQVQGIQGSGNSREETRDVGEFSEVEIQASFTAKITIGKETSVKVKADDNILPLVTTQVVNGRLIVGLNSKEPIFAKSGLVVTISTPRLTALSATGASRIDAGAVEADSFRISAVGASQVHVTDLKAPKLDVEVTGASTVTLSGQGKDVSLKVVGASTVQAGQFSAESVQAEVTGASRTAVQATSQVSGSVVGASSLTVEGKPQTRSVQSTGASSVSYR